MKLLVDHSLISLALPYTAIGNKSFVHDRNIMTTFDTFDKIQPDVYFCNLDKLTNATLLNIKERPHLKVIFINENSNEDKINAVTSEFGNLYPIINDVIYGDIISCKKAKKAYPECDLSILDQGVLNYKNFTLPLKYKVRIFSSSLIANNYYCGTISSANILNLYKSSKMTYATGNNAMNAILCDSYPVDNVNIEFLLSKLNSNLSKEIAEKRKEIMNAKTNIHICSQLFQEIGESDLSKQILNKLEDFV